MRSVPGFMRFSVAADRHFMIGSSPAMGAVASEQSYSPYSTVEHYQCVLMYVHTELMDVGIILIFLIA